MLGFKFSARGSDPMVKLISIPVTIPDLSEGEFEPPAIDDSDEDDLYDVRQRQAHAPTQKSG
jgi:hypothetical protein